MFGAIALTQGLRYHPSQVPHVDQPPTRDEDLSTKPSCQQSYVDNWCVDHRAAAVERDST